MWCFLSIFLADSYALVMYRCHHGKGDRVGIQAGAVMTRSWDLHAIFISTAYAADDEQRRESMDTRSLGMGTRYVRSGGSRERTIAGRTAAGGSSSEALCPWMGA